ncbi:unnamed protein product [Gongylonema pulchrum]|uniref:Cell division cycle protein 27 homolog n=2 Tax=Gongylonema pulchrum TaxID=637853 RepID=A0A183DT63_9BILA|nr:unnamed protein product [Gongylonema pulchrum]
MNRINEMEVTKTPTPSILKLMESSDEILQDTPDKIEHIAATAAAAARQIQQQIKRTRSGSQPGVTPLSSHDQNAVENKQDTPDKIEHIAATAAAARQIQQQIKRTRSGSQPGVTPLSSHDQNAVENKQESGLSTILSRSSSSVSLSPCSDRPRKHCSRSKFRVETCTRIQKRLKLFTAMPPSLQRLQTMLQCALAVYKSNLVIERFNKMPEHCQNYGLARELLARAYLEKLDYSKTAEILEAVHNEFPHRVSGMEIFSTALWHAQDSRRLSMLASHMTEECRMSPESWCVAGNCFSAQKQHEMAITCFERALALEHHYPYGYTLLGHELLDMDQRALTLSPTDYRAWFGLGLLHFKKEQVNLARVHLSRAVALNPYNSVLLCQLSVVEQALHNNAVIFSTALWHAQDSRRLSMLASHMTEECRMSPESWCVAGNCFSAQKQHEMAITCFERALALEHHYPYGYTLLGHELLDMDQRALTLSPTDYRAWFGLGLLHFKKEQVNLARVHLSRAVALNPYNSVLLCQLSVVEQALHNNAVAMDLLQRALKISPDNTACRFYRARLLYELHDYVQCRDELNDLKRSAHDEAQVFFLLGRVHRRLGDTHLALLNFSWAAEMDPRGEQSQSSLSDAPYDDDATTATVVDVVSAE